MLNDLKNIKKSVGLKQSIKSLEKGIVNQVYIAKDADEKVVRKIKEMCLEKNIPVIYIDTMKLLGKACGIDVGAAVVSIFE
ncbi:UNVERIFIED_CONTAM: LSU ribosomal protein L7AE [Acetivibrio alkalicellulosi]